MSVDVDEVPRITAGVRTVNCTRCSWAMTFIQPEEFDTVLCAIMQHCQDHGCSVPTFEVYTH